MLDGGTGNDTAAYIGSPEGVIVNLGTGQASGGDAEGDRLHLIQNLGGSGWNDTLTGDAGTNTLWGGEGNDILSDSGDDLVPYWADNDTLWGMEGADLLVGGDGADVLVAGRRSATAAYIGSAEGVLVNLSTGQGSGGDAQGDTLTGIENLGGSGWDDTLTGDANANTLWGGEGADTLSGEANNDTLWGMEGIDYIYGGAGNDKLIGGEDAGWMNSGAGEERCVC